MKKHPKRRSIFTILLTRVFVIVIFFNAILAGLNIFKAVSDRKEREERRKQQVQEEIIAIIDAWDSVLGSLESMFYSIQSKALHKIIPVQAYQDLKSVNLYKQLELNELDSAYFDLYIIEDGIIVNTTYVPDLGLNLYSFGADFKEFLERVMEAGVFTPESFVMESSTKRLKVYSYQATPDKKYIVEVGGYSETADLIMKMFRNRVNRIVRENKNLLSVNFWMGNDQFQIGFIDETETFAFQDSMVMKSDMEQTDLMGRFKKDDRELLAEYIFLDLDNTTPSFSDVVVSSITDVTDENVPVYTIIKRQVLATTIFLVVLVLVILIATSSFKKVMKDMLDKTTAIANGSLSERVIIRGNNELTTLSEHFNDMVEKLESSYKLLQEQNEEISSQRDEIEAQRNLAFEQKELLAKQNKSIVDSINYALRIQEALLPNQEDIDHSIPNHFILYKPRDIVSGDFYWLSRIENKSIIVAGDCTGHGVPGAFMSMLGAAFLNEIVNNEYITHPGVILRRLRKEVIHALSQKGEYGEQKDGMDIALCALDFENMQLQFAGANNPLYLVRDSKIKGPEEFKNMEDNGHVLYEFKGDKMPIAIHVKMDKFHTQEIHLEKGDTIYMFSDGFPDQFGGKEGKKYMSKNFKKLILKNSHLPLEKQKINFEKEMDKWTIGYDQVDDMLVMGIKIS